ncbi:hypothetical protein Tco_1357128, partial [Tanacetum coccineum]
LAPQPQALGTTFEARVRDYMTAHTKRMERSENTIFKQREEIKTDETPDNTKMPIEIEMPVRKVEAMNGAENEARNESIKTYENDEAVEASGS